MKSENKNLINPKSVELEQEKTNDQILQQAARINSSPEYMSAIREVSFIKGAHWQKNQFISILQNSIEELKRERSNYEDEGHVLSAVDIQFKINEANHILKLLQS